MHRKLSTYLKDEFGEKIYRLALSSGCSCPNRDGTLGSGGCTFCSEDGSGEFAAPFVDVNKQIEEAKKLVAGKSDARKFIAYFQSFTNTYGDAKRLRALYMETIKREDIVILSLGTRPDCIDDEILDMLKELNSIKPVWIELGLQTIHEKTARFVNRGYELEVFEDAYRRLKAAGITVIVHVILGLPGETKEDMLETVRYLAGLEPILDGIKLQNLQLLRGTRMYEQYQESTHLGIYDGAGENGEKIDRTMFHIMSMDEYTDLVAECIALLPDETVIHRMQGDGPRKLLVQPLWSLDKKRVLNMLTKKTKDFLT
nr:TIGR01212 family radical SAM protein [uncultured Butyrivibrio sp.]